MWVSSPVVQSSQACGLNARSEMKTEMEDAHRDKVAEFIEVKCHYKPGSVIRFADFVKHFLLWVQDVNERMVWTEDTIRDKIHIGQYPSGRYGGGGYTHIGNLASDTVPCNQIGEGLIVKVDRNLKLKDV